MRSVTLTRMRRGALLLAAAAVMLAVRMFSAAPAMAEPLVVTEPQQPVMNETIIDDGLGLFGLNNGFVDVNEPGIFSVDHDFDHAKGEHKADKSDLRADKADLRADQR